MGRLARERHHDRLRALLAHAAALFRASAKERAALHKRELDGASSWSALMEAEYFTTLVAGCATTALSDKPHAIRSVASLLANAPFAEWFAENNATYPIFCSYVVVHEHVRTLLLHVERGANKP